MPKKHAYIVQKKSDKNSSGFEYNIVCNQCVIKTFSTQYEAIVYAKDNDYVVHVARVRNLQDLDNPNHWRTNR